MKKSFFAVLMLVSAFAFGAEKNFYYHKGEKIYLTEQSGKYTLITKNMAKLTIGGVSLPSVGKSSFLLNNIDSTKLSSIKKMGKIFPGYKLDKNGSDAYPEGSIFVKPIKAMSESEMKNWCVANNYKFISKVALADGFYLISSDNNPVDTARNLVESGIMQHAEPDFYLKITYNASDFTPNDEYFDKQWHLYNDGNQGSKGLDYTYALEAWRFLKDNGIEPGAGVKLAMIDDGFDLNHEDLAPNIKEAKNFGNNVSKQMYDTDSQSPDTHGTRCAGVAAAAYDNEVGVAGACPNCELYLGRMPYDWGSFQKVIDAFNWAQGTGARILSNSWSLPMSDAAYESAVKTLKNAGMIIVYAAGNEFGTCASSKYDFVTMDDVILVGATDSEGVRSSYSNYCSALDIVAPGAGYSGSPQGGGTEYDHLWTTDISGWDGESDSDYVDFIGTSAATPLVAGIIGLVFSANPNLSFDQVYDIITTTADQGQSDANYSNGKSDYYGYGRINALEAVKLAFSMKSACTADSCPDGYTCNTASGICEKSSTPEPDEDSTIPTNDETPVPDNNQPPVDNGVPVNDTENPINDTTNPTNDSTNPTPDNSNPSNDTTPVENPDNQPVITDETSGCGCSII